MVDNVVENIIIQEEIARPCRQNTQGRAECPCRGTGFYGARWDGYVLKVGKTRISTVIVQPFRKLKL
jgi:hypothetical protein